MSRQIYVGINNRTLKKIMHLYINIENERDMYIENEREM